MDPDQTYDDFLDALKDGDVLVASHRLDDLATWISRGDFVPEKLKPRMTPTPELARLLMSVVVLPFFTSVMRDPSRSTAHALERTAPPIWFSVVDDAKSSCSSQSRRSSCWCHGLVRA